MTSITEELVPAGELQLLVHTAGPADGHPVVLVHGFPDTGMIWDNQMRGLAAAGYRVIAPDTRGCGGSDAPADSTAYAISDLMSDLGAILEVLEIERPTLVGHDVGGSFTWLVGALMPERVARIVTMSVGYPAGFGNLPLDQLQRYWYLLLFCTDAAEQFLQRDDWAGMKMIAEHPRQTETQRRLAEPGALSNALAWYRCNISPTQFATYNTAAPPVRVPTMAMWGTGEPIAAESQITGSERFVEAPFRYTRVDSSTHWMQVSAADEVNRALLAFLADG